QATGRSSSVASRSASATRRTIGRTSKPASSSASTVACPIPPAAPVTATDPRVVIGLPRSSRPARSSLHPRLGADVLVRAPWPGGTRSEHQPEAEDHHAEHHVQYVIGGVERDDVQYGARRHQH